MKKYIFLTKMAEILPTVPLNINNLKTWETQMETYCNVVCCYKPTTLRCVSV